MRFLIFGFIIGAFASALWMQNATRIATPTSLATESIVATIVARLDVRNDSVALPIADKKMGYELQQTVVETTKRSREVEKKIRILCWIPSRESRGRLIDRIHETWAKTCDLLIFSSKAANPEKNVIKVEYPLDQNLWNMVHPAWTYLEENYLDKYDWFIKLDDDTYFVGDNFKSLVQNRNPDDHYYLGHTAYEVSKSVTDPKAPFNLGAGHALSRGSLRRLGPFLPNSNKTLPEGHTRKCDRWVSWAEDVKLSDCLWIAGIGGPTNSKDTTGRENFMSFPPQDNFVTVRRPDSKSWFWRGKPMETGSGARCCSSRPILWHGLKDDWTGCFYYLHYFLFNVMVDPVRMLEDDESILYTS